MNTINDEVLPEIADLIEVKLPKANTQEEHRANFLKIRETLTRIGIASYQQKKLIQSCHILHKRERYYIVHFKELFRLDGKPSDFTEDDKARRNKIVNLLAQWKLVTLVDPRKSLEPQVHANKIVIIPFKEKNNWLLESKHAIGKKRRQEEDTRSRLYPNG